MSRGSAILPRVNVWTTLQRALDHYPHKVGVVDGPRSFTYREVARRAAALACHLRRRGVGARDRVAVLELNTHAMLEATYAAAALGAVLCPLNYRLSPRELAFILDDAGARLLLANRCFGEQVARLTSSPQQLEGLLWCGDGDAPALPLPAEDLEQAVAAELDGPLEPAAVEADALAHLYYTSGTTGRPKGVMLTHGNVCHHALGAVAELGLRDRDVWGHIAPMFHLADAWATVAMTLVGGRHVMVPRFGPRAALRAIEQGGVTISNLIPTMLNLMIKHPAAAEHDYSSLRAILSGGAPIAPEVVRRIMSTFGCEYVQTYGMTETSPYLTLSLLKDHLRALPEEEQQRYRASTGRPFITVELKVVGDDGAPVRPDGEQVGEIRVRGDTVTPGYWNLPDETAAAFSDDGWLCTGDLAVLDAEGYVNIVDRKKDMIISGGENIYSIEVENTLYEHPAVLEAAVYGAPDETWGEVVRAAVVLRPGRQAGAQELVEFCRQRLAAFKAPRGVDFLDELPRTGSGKITKKALKKTLGARRG